MDSPFLLYNSELYYSALTVSDFLIVKNEIEKEVEVLLRIIIAKSLYNLKLYHRALRYIDKYDDLLEYECIRTTFLKLNHIIDKKSIHLNSLSLRQCVKIKMPEMKLDRKSIEKHLEGIIQASFDKKNCLVESFEMENRNFESLLVLKRESLLTEEELGALLSSCSQEMREFYESVLFYDQNILNSPYFSENVGLRLYNQKNKNDLIFLGMYHLDNYPTESTSLFLYGLSNILQRKYSDSKIILYDALKKERSFGLSWLLLGISYSNLREYDCAISSFELSKTFMIGSYKPDYFLALEYHKMSNMNQANIFYLNSLRIKREPLVMLKYCALLIHYEYYIESLKLLESLRTKEPLKNIHLLLLTYSFLFLGELEKAKTVLEEIERDWRYYATRGYLSHLQSQVDDATQFYTNALIERGRSWIIEDLMKNAIELKDLQKDNLVYDYGTSLFEFLDLKSTDITLHEI